MMKQTNKMVTLEVHFHYEQTSDELGYVLYELSLNDTKTYDEVNFSVRNNANESCTLDSAKFNG